MAKLYTSSEMHRALKQLRIKDVDGTVTSQEAATIWTWRVKEEDNIDHTYKDSATRQRVKQKQLIPVNPDKRPSRFKIEDVFHISLAPNRAKSHNPENSSKIAV